MSDKVYQKSFQAIQDRGFLLVFAMKDKDHPSSLWSELYPNSKMSWDWDEDGDSRVHNLWRTRQQLAESHDVVYGKFYRNRATFLSKKVFCEILSVLGVVDRISAADRLDFEAGLSEDLPPIVLSRAAKELLEVLEMDSPLSTKELRKVCELQGKDNEKFFTKGTTELWRNFLIAGVGEVDDGAFPSLAYASSKNFFEAEWNLSQKLDPAQSYLNLMSLPDAEAILEMLEKADEERLKGL